MTEQQYVATGGERVPGCLLLIALPFVTIYGLGFILLMPPLLFVLDMALLTSALNRSNAYAKFIAGFRGRRHGEAVSTIEAYYRTNEELLRDVFPRPRLLAELKVRAPDSVSEEEAWKGTLGLFTHLQDLVEKRNSQRTPTPTAGQSRVEQLQSDIAAYDQRIAQMEQEIAREQAKGNNTTIQEREINRFRRERNDCADELESFMRGN